ncbi:hypothetical protein BG000_006225, partial [Podila horticola]
PILRESNDDDDAVADLHHLFDLNPVPVDAEKENERDEVRGPAEEEEEEETLVRRRPLQPPVPISVQDNGNHNDNHERVRHSINKGNCMARPPPSQATTTQGTKGSSPAISQHGFISRSLSFQGYSPPPPQAESSHAAKKRAQARSRSLDLAMPLKIL